MKIKLMRTLSWPQDWKFKKAKTWNIEKYAKYLPLGVERKFNGLRLLGVKDLEGRVGIFPRKVSRVTGDYVNKWKKLPVEYRRIVVKMPKEPQLNVNFTGRAFHPRLW